MKRVRERGEQIRRFILENVKEYPIEISKRTADKFDISRQAVNKHLKRLVEEGCLVADGKTRNQSYKLAPILEIRKVYDLGPQNLAEDIIWTNDVRPLLENLPENVLGIWQYGVTEIINNANDHSGGTQLTVTVSKTAVGTTIIISDNGIGIFKKIQNELGLIDERHAILELSKGKLTTDPARHTGEGLFFTSRLFDSFDILSGGVFYTHQFGVDNDVLLEREKSLLGTHVFLELNNHTARTTKKIFDQYASPEGDYSFNKTIVPVRLAQYGNDKLVSRSQAKRLLSRVELFQTVIFDFKEVSTIGQAFADEIFRVFASQHPDISLLTNNANSEVRRMISRATSGDTKAD